MSVFAGRAPRHRAEKPVSIKIIWIAGYGKNMYKNPIKPGLDVSFRSTFCCCTYSVFGGRLFIDCRYTLPKVKATRPRPNKLCGAFRIILNWIWGIWRISVEISIWSFFYACEEKETLTLYLKTHPHHEQNLLFFGWFFNSVSRKKSNAFMNHAIK